jgi:aminodeoxyfutalosine synthase
MNHTIAESPTLFLEGLDSGLEAIAQKVISGTRITVADCVQLYEHGSIGLLGSLANLVRERKNGNATFFI